MTIPKPKIKVVEGTSPARFTVQHLGLEGTPHDSIPEAMAEAREIHLITHIAHQRVENIRATERLFRMLGEAIRA